MFYYYMMIKPTGSGLRIRIQRSNWIQSQPGSETLILCYLYRHCKWTRWKMGCPRSRWGWRSLLSTKPSIISLAKIQVASVVGSGSRWWKNDEKTAKIAKFLSNKLWFNSFYFKIKFVINLISSTVPASFNFQLWILFFLRIFDWKCFDFAFHPKW